jgi:hypothetical protein
LVSYSSNDYYYLKETGILMEVRKAVNCETFLVKKNPGDHLSINFDAMKATTSNFR